MPAMKKIKERRKYMKSYRLIVFDLDGTLTEPSRGLLHSYAYALERMGVDPGPREDLLRFIGPPLFDEWQRVYGFTPAEAKQALNYFTEYFQPYGWCENDLYPGIPRMLADLRAAGKKIALATSKPENFARQILQLFGIDGCFDKIGGALSDTRRDKKWEVLDYVLDSFPDIPRTDCLMVGDRMYDAEGAGKCGIDSLGVLWGHGSEEELSHAGFTALVRRVEDVVPLLTE